MMDIIIIILEIYGGAVISALISNYLMKRKGLEGIDYKECFYPTKIFGVVVGFILKYAFPQHILEQYILRFYSDECRESCLLGNDGKCISCGCDTVAKMWSPFEKDSKKNWRSIIWSKEEYKEFRKRYPVTIKIIYGKDGSI